MCNSSSVQTSGLGWLVCRYREMNSGRGSRCVLYTVNTLPVWLGKLLWGKRLKPMVLVMAKFSSLDLRNVKKDLLPGAACI